MVAGNAIFIVNGALVFNQECVIEIFHMAIAAPRGCFVVFRGMMTGDTFLLLYIGMYRMSKYDLAPLVFQENSDWCAIRIVWQDVSE